MAANTRDDDDGLVSGINVTPLVDITLVLLIIFMVTAKLIDGRAIPMVLPSTATTGEVQTVFGIDLFENGDTIVNGARVPSDEAVLALATDAGAKNAQIRALIRAETKVPHGRVIRVLDLLKQAHVDKIAFGVSQTPIPPGARP